jgi:uncharacterized protein
MSLYIGEGFFKPSPFFNFQFPKIRNLREIIKNKKMKDKILIFLGFLLVFSCKSTEKVQYAANEILPKEKALLWKISANGLKKPSYLFGTIHLIPKSEFDFNELTKNALKSTQRIAFEIDMKEMTNLSSQISLMGKAFMAGGKTLRDLLTPEDYAFVRTKMDSKGLPLTMMERMKPMFLSTMFGTDEESSAASNANMTSVEMELFKLSKKQKKESAGLETAAYQMGIFDSIPYEAQAKMLVDALKSTDGGDDDFGKMIDLYQSKNIQEMQSSIISAESGMKDYEDLLLNKRNANWIAPMGRMMRDKPTFFAVGAGHLAGKSGVIALLRKQGYRVEAVD